MKKLQIISIISIAVFSLYLSSSVSAQSLYTKTGDDVTWKYITDNKLIPIGESSTKGITGSKIDVNQDHPAINSSPYKNRAIIKDMSIHTLGNTTINRPDFPKWSRWYQEDVNTQIFRLFKGEINVGNDTYYKPRIEAELQNHSKGLKIINGADWVEWNGTYTIVEPVESNIFQIWSNDDYVLMLEMDNNGRVQLNPRDQSGHKTMVENAKGKSFDVTVRDYGNKYEVYLNGKLFYNRSYKAAYPDRAGHFRWGIYASMKKGTTGGVPKDAMMFVTGAKRRFSNDPSDNLSTGDDLEYANSKLTVFPNPSTEGIFNLSEEISYNVYDSLGKLISNGKGNKVDLSLNANGVYIMRFGSRYVKLVR